MPAFQRRHYQALADTLASVRRDALADADLFTVDTCDRFTEILVSRFRRDNPRFQPDRFREACKVAA